MSRAWSYQPHPWGSPSSTSSHCSLHLPVEARRFAWLLTACAWGACPRDPLALAVSGPWVVPYSLSAEYSGVIEGAVNGAGNLIGVVAPAVTGWMLEAGGCSSSNHSAKAPPNSPQCHEAWNYVFYTAAASSVFAWLVFLLFGTAEPMHFTEHESASDDKPPEGTAAMRVNLVGAAETGEP